MGLSIAEAVGRLDPADDAHWTADGLPRVDAVARIVGRAVVRGEITDAAPSATRTKALEAAALQSAPPAEAAAPPAPGAPQDAPQAAQGGAPPAPAAGPPGAESAPQAPPAAPQAPPAALVVEAVEGDSGQVAPADDDVLELPFDRVLAAPDLVRRALAEADRRALVLARRRDQVARGLEALGRLTSHLEAAAQAHDRAAGVRPNSGIQDYLARQRQVRADRALRARKFLEAGVTPKEVAAELSTRSRLDAALGQRRPAPGAARPSYPRAEP